MSIFGPFLDRVFPCITAPPAFKRLFDDRYCKGCLKKYGLTNATIIKSKKFRDHQDYSRLFGKAWLNDVCVNEHIRLQIEGKKEFGYIDSLVNLSRVTRKKTANLFETKKMLFAPLHINGNHWGLLAIDIRSRRFRYYDSLSCPPPLAAIKAIRVYLEKIALEECVILDDNDFLLNIEPCPKQENSADCGIFVLLAVHYLIQNKPLDYTQADASYMRLRVLSDLARL